MKRLDIYLQHVRIDKAAKYIRKGDSVLDIGTSDGAMFRRLKHLISKGTGVEPNLPGIIQEELFTLYPGYFPDACPQGVTYDAITLLAVLEHIPPDQQLKLAQNCARFLNKNGRVIITVPSPQVDIILAVLTKLKILDGMELEEHYGFNPKETPKLFSKADFKLLKKETFQFGLNNLFVFEKIS